MKELVDKALSELPKSCKPVRISMNYKTSESFPFQDYIYKGMRSTINNHLEDGDFTISFSFELL